MGQRNFFRWRRLIYHRPEDPRLFVYKQPRWLGVTLNFGHPRAVPVLILLQIPVAAVWIGRWVPVAGAGVLVGGLTGAVWFSFYRARREERSLRSEVERRQSQKPNGGT